MTQDYKDILLKYITNNLSKEEGVNIPSFSQVQTTSASDLYDTLNDTFEYGFRQNGVIQCKNVNGEYNGFIIVYGMYWTDEDKTDSLAKGYMLLFDNNFELVQIITKYKSGTDCGIFMKVVVNNDGTLIALDHFDNRNRFLMLNNPSVKLPSAQNYSLNLRSSYNLQGNVQNISYTMTGKMYLLDKDPNSANYMIGAYDNTDLFEGLVQLTINVGTANTWTNYSYSKPTPYTTNIHDIMYTYIYWQEGKPQLYVYDSYTGYSNNTDMWYGSLYLIKNNANSTNLNQVSLVREYGVFAENVLTGSALAFISPTNYYFTFSLGIPSQDTTSCSIQTWHVENGIFTDYVYSDDFDIDEETGLSGGYFDIEMYNLNGTICMIYSTITSRLASATLMGTKAILITSNNEAASIGLATPNYADYMQFHINTIINQFDLYKFYIIVNDYDAGMSMNKSDIVYNYLYYNGDPYENVNALKANQGMLYDVNGNIFVRGVYNHIVNDNITEDTIQIPNTMVNDIQITQNKLLSQTNQPMVINNETIEKNIYETLYINYFNEINIENRNTATTISNKDAAIRLNYTISDELDYDSATITKYRINYHDGTSLINNVDDIIIDEGVATITIHFYVDKQIDSIDLLSNDEETYYQRITSNLNIGSLYTLTQECYVD